MAVQRCLRVTAGWESALATKKPPAPKRSLARKTTRGSGRFARAAQGDQGEHPQRNRQERTRQYAVNVCRTQQSERNRQLACKPGSVWPRSPKATERGSHSSGTALARSLLQPTRMTGPETGWTLARPRHPYSVLLPVGFAVPSMSPCPRWALTPPFHPYSAKRSGLLSVALSLRSPSPDVIRHRISVEPGLSSPRGLSALAESGCPANWHALLKPARRSAPEKTAGFLSCQQGRSDQGDLDAPI